MEREGRPSGHTYSNCSVHHHCADGEHQERDGESNAGILCVVGGDREMASKAGWEREQSASFSKAASAEH